MRWGYVFVLVIVGSILALQVNVRDDALDLLPGEAVRGDLELLQKMGLVDRLFLTLSLDPELDVSRSQATDLIKKNTDLAGEALAKQEVLADVFYRFPAGYEWALLGGLQAHIPAMIRPDELAKLESKLTEAGLKQIFANHFALLNSPSGIGLKKQIQRDPLGINALLFKQLNHLRDEFSVIVDDGFFLSRDGRNSLLTVQSRLPLTDSKSAEQVELAVKQALSGLDPEMRCRIIGTLPHTLANAHTVQGDLRLLLPIASILLLTLLLVGLRDGRALLVFGVPFLAAPAAIGITGLIFGKVSGLALGFGIVLLGVSVDFAVHLYLALSREKGSQSDILQRLARPITLATLTTGGVFVVLLFSQVPSHRQMAVLALIGILLAVALSWVIIPAIARSARSKQPREPMNPVFLQIRSSFHKKIMLLFWIFFLGTGTLAWTQLQYNGDLRLLDVHNQEVLADEAYFNKIWRHEQNQAFVVSSGATLDQALNGNSRVYEQLLAQDGARFQSVAPLLPGPKIQKENVTEWKRFWAKQRPLLHTVFPQMADQAGFSAEAFAPFFKWLGREPVLIDYDNLLHGPMQPLFASMIRYPHAAGDGNILITTTVVEDETVLAALHNLARSDDGITVLDNRTWRQQVEKMLRRDVALLSLAAGSMIICLTWIFFRRAKDVLAVLAPVASALAAMAIFGYLTNRDLNMMHGLMGIMVIGLSVDYGIFVACGVKEGTGFTLVAVSICAASSIIGFGVLAFAAHPALHTLGVTVISGIGAAWPTALFITPLLTGSAEAPA